MDQANDLSSLAFDESSRSSSGRRRRRTISIVASLLAHLALLLLFFLGVGGGAAPVGGGGDDDANAIVVTLAGRMGTTPTQSAQPASRLDLLFRQLHDAQSPLTADTEKHEPSNANARQLLDAVDDQRPTKDTGQGSGKADVDRGGSGASLSGSKTDVEKKAKGAQPTSTSGAGGSGSSAGGGLWGQIKPCWDKLGSATVPVSLEITLDRNGKIATPPRILRPNAAAADETRLIAEARALAAVAACVPYHAPTPANGQAVVRVDFAARH